MELVDVAGLAREVRAGMAGSGVEVTPHSVAATMRVIGRPVGDANVLAVYEYLLANPVECGCIGKPRRDWRGNLCGHTSTPDPALIVGDWTGEGDARVDREALAYRSLIAQLRTMHANYALWRANWAKSPDPHAAARAVAYQRTVSDLNRIITDAEQIAGVKKTSG